MSIERVLGNNYLLDVRYVGNKGTRLPRMTEANPAISGPGASRDNADQRRIYAGCSSTVGPCNFASVGLISNISNSTYHALQVALSRHFVKRLVSRFRTGSPKVWTTFRHSMSPRRRPTTWQERTTWLRTPSIFAPSTADLCSKRAIVSQSAVPYLRNAALHERSPCRPLANQ